MAIPFVIAISGSFLLVTTPNNLSKNRENSLHSSFESFRMCTNATCTRTCFSLLLLILMPVFQAKAKPQDKQPNVVIVITDDQGYGDLACHGNKVIKTPSLDALHAESVRLIDYHVAPTCSPTRAALQSGHWTNRTGAWHTIMGRSMLREDEPTIGQVFSDAGYVTGMFGKWHLGDNYPFRPEDRGYQEVMRHGGGGVGQTPDYWDNAYFDGTYFHNSKPEAVKGFCTDVFFDYAKRFIKSQKGSGKPFLAYIATNAPHGPFHCPTKYSKMYSQSKGVDARLANFLGMITNIDDNVGAMRKFLEDEGLADNTIFIFTTDNGTAGGDKVFNANMRGKKGSQYDGGHRVPFFVHWPAGKMNKPIDIRPVTHAVDVLPTLMELCGIDNDKSIQFDGTSLVELLDGSTPNEKWNQRVLITDSQRVKDPIMWKSSAVMTTKWRLVDGKELYDINADPRQRVDLAEAYPAEVRRLREHYQTWWEELLPSYKRPAEIYLGHPAENPAVLTSHDWIAKNSTPWNQASIRKGADSPNVTGFWHVKVHKAGKYKIALRRWPKESGVAINEGMKPGPPVEGARAFRETQGRKFDFTKATIEIGGKKFEMPVNDDSQEVVFELELSKGPAKLACRFIGKDDKPVGAYYAYVECLE